MNHIFIPEKKTIVSMPSFYEIVLNPLRRCLNDDAGKDAFYIDGKSYTYGSFGEIINSIREAVAKCSDIIVGLVIRDDMETYASIIALWMEGKAYVPLHPFHPHERNLEIVRQVGLNYIIDTSKKTEFSNLNVINPKKMAISGECFDEVVSISDDALAYILFTSGSTGKPKGVRITRGNVASFMDSFWKTGIFISSEDRCLQCFDLTFDVSVQSFLVALTRGACLYTVPYGQVKYLYVASLIHEQHITFGAMAPSMLTYLRPYFGELDAASLKSCILTAEACPVDLLEEWSHCAVNADLYDFYGPTEATIYCTYYKYNRGEDNLSSNGIVSIGKPLANVQWIIIDEEGNALLEMGKGELCIAGPQLSPGYWNDDEKNKASFFVRLAKGDEIRYYHTGDLCYMDVSGNLMYVERIDRQAKIQGFRVELSEIEFYAREFYHNKARVVAMACNNSQGLSEIALFVESTQIDPNELLSYLREKMPAYMIPSRVIFEDEFPINSSDKIDRKKLKDKLL